MKNPKVRLWVPAVLAALIAFSSQAGCIPAHH